VLKEQKKEVLWGGGKKEQEDQKGKQGENNIKDVFHQGGDVTCGWTKY